MLHVKKTEDWQDEFLQKLVDNEGNQTFGAFFSADGRMCAMGVLYSVFGYDYERWSHRSPEAPSHRDMCDKVGLTNHNADVLVHMNDSQRATLPQIAKFLANKWYRPMPENAESVNYPTTKEANYDEPPFIMDTAPYLKFKASKAFGASYDFNPSHKERPIKHIYATA